MGFVKGDNMPVMMVKRGVVLMDGQQADQDIAQRVRSGLDHASGLETERVEIDANGDIEITFREMINHIQVQEVNLHVRAALTV